MNMDPQYYLLHFIFLAFRIQMPNQKRRNTMWKFVESVANMYKYRSVNLQSFALREMMIVRIAEKSWSEASDYSLWIAMQHVECGHAT